MFRSAADMQTADCEKCHDGVGITHVRFVMGEGDSDAGVRFMHDDTLDPGATIGEHPHEGSEEIYFLVEGCGVMILDGREYPMGPGDVCLCKSGHSHGLRNTSEAPMRLIVVGLGG